jgi:hypothetical protein
MTHRQVLLHELAQHGRVTYRELMDRYEDRGYTIDSFRAAVKAAADRGLVKGPGKGHHGGYIVRMDTGVCPCCGRQL